RYRVERAELRDRPAAQAGERRVCDRFRQAGEADAPRLALRKLPRPPPGLPRSPHQPSAPPGGPLEPSLSRPPPPALRLVYAPRAGQRGETELDLRVDTFRGAEWVIDDRGARSPHQAPGLC